MIPVLADSRPDLHPHFRLHRPRHHTHYSQGSVETPTRNHQYSKNKFKYFFSLFYRLPLRIFKLRQKVFGSGSGFWIFTSIRFRLRLFTFMQIRIRLFIRVLFFDADPVPVFYADPDSHQSEKSW